MSSRTCTQCHNHREFLEWPSPQATVDHYVCRTCGEVWAYDKLRPDDLRQRVTVDADPAKTGSG